MKLSVEFNPRRHLNKQTFLTVILMPECLTQELKSTSVHFQMNVLHDVRL